MNSEVCEKTSGLFFLEYDEEYHDDDNPLEVLFISFLRSVTLLQSSRAVALRFEVARQNPFSIEFDFQPASRSALLSAQQLSSSAAQQLSSSAAALLLGALLGGLRDDDGLPFSRALGRVVFRLEGLLANYLVNLGQDVLKRFFYVGGVQGTRLDEGESLLLAEGLGVLGLDRPQVPQVALISHKHDHYVAIRMVPELLQPPANVVERGLLRDVVHQQGTHSTPVVCAGDRPVPLLASRVPNLSFDRLSVHLHAPGCELNPNGGLGLQHKLIARETTEKLRLSHRRVPDEDDLEQVVEIVVWFSW
mmetsp:Transcript_29935/g.63811  ORF Transcript_29935/g.63811 Transcript_29935/m.63811 type:complete len:305 (+) Transcript_29935:896-1810(+)